MSLKDESSSSHIRAVTNVSLRPASCRSCVARLCAVAVAVSLQTVGATSHTAYAKRQQQEQQHSSSSSNAVSVTHNLPIQLVIIIGSVVLAATIIGSLAWLFRYSGHRGSDDGWFSRLGTRQRRGLRKNSFDPNRPGSVYDFGDAGSIDGLSLKEKSDVSHDKRNAATTANGRSAKSNCDRAVAATLSPLSPMPALKLDADTQHATYVTKPETAAVKSPVPRGRGWQLFDGKPASTIDPTTLDVEANGGLPPARRPSFIDRLMAHRSLSHSQISKSASDPVVAADRSITSPAPVQPVTNGNGLPERSYTTPAALLGGGNGLANVPNTPGTTGSALLSAINGAFRRVSQHKDHYATQARRKFVPSPRQLPIESDFEGTIGGRDADLPMARRSNNRRLLCGDSMHSPSVRNDFMPTPPDMHGDARGLTSGQLAPRSFAHSPLAPSAERHQHPLHPQQQQSRDALAIASKVWHNSLTPARFGTPHQTPGLAGVGTTWLRRMSENTFPVISEEAERVKHSTHPLPLHMNPKAQRLSLNEDQKRQHDSQQASNGYAGVGTGISSSAGRKGERKSELQSWIAHNSNSAAVPPPEVVSRRGSDISFALTERSIPSVSRQNSMSNVKRPRQERSESQEAALRMKSNLSDIQRAPSINPHFAPVTTLHSWLEPEAVTGAARHDGRDAEKALDLDQYYRKQADTAPVMGTPQTDYHQTRGVLLWEDVDRNGPPSYKTSANASQKSTASRKRRSSAAAVRVQPSLPAYSPRVRHGMQWTEEHERLEAEKRNVEKKMRKRLRQARKAARSAAREAALAESNRAASDLPAHHGALVEQGDLMSTTTLNKDSNNNMGNVQALHNNDVNLASINGNEKEDGDTSSQSNTAPKEWVQELLMDSPRLPKDDSGKSEKVMQTEHASSTRLARTKDSIKRDRNAQRDASNTSRRHSKNASYGAVARKQPATYVPARRIASRAPPLARILSPPESPLTSASERPYSPPPLHTSSDQGRRASLPASSFVTGPRSFLVESRRGSKETQTSSSRSTSTTACSNEKRSANLAQAPSSRVVSMPNSAAPSRRRLPMPPVNAFIDANPVSAYDQFVNPSVYIA